MLRNKFQVSLANELIVKGTDGVRTRDLRFTRPTPYHLATAPDKCAYFWLPSIPFFPWILFFHGRDYKEEKKYGSGGIRTHASEETGALNQRLRPLGHATSVLKMNVVLNGWQEITVEPKTQNGQNCQMKQHSITTVLNSQTCLVETVSIDLTLLTGTYLWFTCVPSL